MTKERIDYITFLQFIGPLFVIFGHAMNDVMVPDVLLALKKWVYTFHMPLFFVLSSYLFFYRGGLTRENYTAMIKKKFSRLMVPYLFWNVLFIIPKFFARSFIRNQVQFSAAYIFRVFIWPRDAIWGHTWFLFALFELYLFIFIFDFFRKNKKTWIPVTIVLILLNIVATNNRFLAVGDIMKESIFFWMGTMLSVMDASKLNKLASSRKTLLLLVISCIITTGAWYKLNTPISILLCGTSVLALLICIGCNINTGNPIISYISYYSFGVYILHWPCVIIMRILFYQILKIPALAAFVLLFISGIIMPVIIITALKKIPVINKLKIVKVVVGI